MSATTQRIWIPSTPYIRGTTLRTSVRRWVWTRRKGLRVEFLDGTECKSDHGTLREFLQAVKEQRETAREVTI